MTSKEVLSYAVGPDGTVYAQNPAFVLKFREGANDKEMTLRLANADDDRSQGVFTPGIRGKTDRFVLKLVKDSEAGS